MFQKVTGYLPKDDGARLAFKDADLIVIPAGIPRTYTYILLDIKLELMGWDRQARNDP